MSKRPGWVTGVGITGIVWGFLGMVAGYAALFPMQFFNLTHPQAQLSVATEALDTVATDPEMIRKMATQLSQVHHAPNWVWTMLWYQGALTALIGLVMIVCAIRLLKMVPNVSRIFSLIVIVDFSNVILRAVLFYMRNGQLVRSRALQSIVPTLFVSVTLLLILRAKGKDGFSSTPDGV